jgi:16S rRNA U1498 N3-methylase RsmE
MLFCSQGTAERLTAELSAARDQLYQKEQELRVTTEKLKEKEEMLRAIGGEGGTTPDLLLELHQQNTLNDFPPSSCSTQTFRMATASKVSMLFVAFQTRAFLASPSLR